MTIILPIKPSYIGASANPHGRSDHSTVTRNKILPLGDFFMQVAGAGGGTANVTDSQTRYAYVAFADSSDNYIGGNFDVPDDWVSGTISFYIHLMMAGTNTGTKVVRIDMLGDAFARSTTGVSGINFSLNNTTDITINNTAEQQQRVALNGTITPTIAGQSMKLRVGRLGNNVNDTAVGNMLLVAVEIEYTGRA